MSTKINHLTSRVFRINVTDEINKHISSTASLQGAQDIWHISYHQVGRLIRADMNAQLRFEIFGEGRWPLIHGVHDFGS